MDKLHVCKEIKDYWGDDESDKTFIAYKKNEKAWHFIFKHYADQEEVDMREADEEGELLLSVEFKIVFCPYCGALLGP